MQTKSYAAQSPTDRLSDFIIERRETGPHDVRIEILYCGVCHTDLHQVRNDWGFSIYPMVPGHEIVGRVTEVGDHVKKFKVGDIAGVGCLIDSCRTCDNCIIGEEQYCFNGWTATYNSLDMDGKTPTFGGYSKEIVVQEDFTLRVSDKLPLGHVAPLLCAGITTYSPLRRFKVGRGQRVGVLGLGGLGHMAVKFAASFGAEVTMISRTASKEADAKELGAHNFVLSTDETAMKNVANYFDLILDTVAVAHDYEMYLALLKPKGTLVCVGIPTDPIKVSTLGVIFYGRIVAGSLIGGLPETQEMLDYCADHNITADVEIINMKDINECYERLIRGDVRYRFVIDMATL
ncbi:NAD(P)-dependent alcohol dehydrogenase [Flavitalea sp.]|nr:NAD(P)-dependent alcohol dehydrogenase [Flavitalea sp.]